MMATKWSPVPPSVVTLATHHRRRQTVSDWCGKPGAFSVAGAGIGRDNGAMTLSAQLTHFGVHTTDLDRMVDFYTRVMGFVVSDSGTGRSGARVAFMTQNPECHHQFVLFDGRPQELAYNPVKQISFRLDS